VYSLEKEAENLKKVEDRLQHQQARLEEQSNRIIRKTNDLADAKKSLEKEMHNLELFGAAMEETIAIQKKEIEEKEENFKNFFDTIDDFLFVLDPSGTIIKMNQTAINRLGYPEEELIGKKIFNLYPDKTWDEADNIVQDIIEENTKYCTLPFVTSSGEFIPVDIRMFHGKWSGRQALFVVSKNLKEIRASQEKFVKIFQDNPALIFICTVCDGKFIEVNNTFLKTLGYHKHEVIGKTLSQLKLFKDNRDRSTFKKAIKNQEIIKTIDVGLLTQKGAIRYCTASSEIITLDAQACLLTVMNDMTEGRKFEEVSARSKNKAEAGNQQLTKNFRQATQGSQQGEVTSRGISELPIGRNDYLDKPLLEGDMKIILEEHLNPNAELEEESVSSGDSTVPVRLQRLQEISSGDSDFERELIDSFIFNNEQHVTALDEALREINTNIFEREAHNIKGATSTLGAPKLEKLANELEKIGSRGDLKVAPEALNDLKEEFNRVIDYLKKYLADEISDSDPSSSEE